MDTNIVSMLTQLGLNLKEAETFSALSQYLDGSTVLDLSRELNLPRPTVYSHLETLMMSGFVKKGIKENTSIFYPESKEVIESIFEEKITLLKKTKESFSVSFDEKKKVTKFKPKFFTYEGPNAYEQVWRDILRTREETYWVWSLRGMLERGVSSEKLEEFHKERIKRGIGMNVLWPDKAKVDIKKSPFLISDNEQKTLRKVRILPKGFDQDVGYGIYGNKVAFISAGSENYAFVIESKELVQTLKKQFDFFWCLSKKYS
jgi:sugar-specific transcriptional regulator TrmB